MDRTSQVATFTIENSGSGLLNLTGVPVVEITGTDKGHFDTPSQPPTEIAGGGSTTFTLTFTPTDLVQRSATVTVESTAEENPVYTFDICGTGGYPDISIRQDTDNIASGTGSFDFGDVEVGQSISFIPFTIYNTADADLALTGAPKIEITGSDAASFSVGTDPASPIAGGTFTSFALAFSPDSLGDKAAAISIPNDDPDAGEAPYTFDVTGTTPWYEVYFDDFESVVSGWTDNASSTCGDTVTILGGYGFFGFGAFTERTFTGLDAHSALRIEFDFLAIDSWDSEDAFALLDGTEVWRETFNALTDFSSNICGASFNDSGPMNRTAEVAHSASSVTLYFSSTLNQSAADESWGVDNVKVEIK